MDVFIHRFSKQSVIHSDGKTHFAFTRAKQAKKRRQQQQLRLLTDGEEIRYVYGSIQSKMRTRGAFSKTLNKTLVLF